MPTILRLGPYRVFFYSNEGHEPPHVHVERESMWAKVWLRPITLAASRGFRSAELTRILWLVRVHREEFANAWDAHFRRRG